MITRWKKQKNGDYIGRWCGVTLVLTMNPKTTMWSATASNANGTDPIPDVWHTAIFAMDAIDAMQQRIVMDKMADHPQVRRPVRESNNGDHS